MLQHPRQKGLLSPLWRYHFHTMCLIPTTIAPPSPSSSSPPQIQSSKSNSDVSVGEQNLNQQTRMTNSVFAHRNMMGGSSLHHVREFIEGIRARKTKRTMLSANRLNMTSDVVKGSKDNQSCYRGYETEVDT